MTQRASNQENSLPTSRDLFGESPQQPSKRASGSKLGPKGGKHYVQPWGYYAPPGTGPVGETCKTCAHICVRGFAAGRYLKCLRDVWLEGQLLMHIIEHGWVTNGAIAARVLEIPREEWFQITNEEIAA